MIKTLTLDGLTSVTIKQSAYDMARFCWIYNHSESDIFASCVNSECTENADNVLRIPAGEPRMIDTESYETLYLNGSGTVELITSAYSVCPFKRAAKGGGASLSGSASYTINNAVDYPLMGLNLYGKSTQDGTPTPDNPVDIVSVGDSGSVEVQACGKNLFPWNDYTKIPYSVSGQATVLVTADKIKYQNIVGDIGGFFVAAPAISPILSKYNRQMITFSAEVKSDNSASIAFGTYRTFSRYSVQNEWEKISHTLYYDIDDTFIITCEGTETTVYIRNIQIEIGDTATAYEPYHGATANITTALPLCGIPVVSDGNYTDSNGRQWICDELIYNADGTGKIIKKIGNIIFDGSEEWAKSGATEIDRYILRNVSAKKGIRITSGLCNTYIVDVSETGDTELGKILLYPTYYDQISVNFAEYGTSTVETFKDYLKNNPIVLCTDLIEPQEMELTAAEMTALKQLQTFNGTTNISNSGGAEMNVKYCTNKMLSECVLPITMGLQKQIDELRAAVLSMGGNV